MSALAWFAAISIVGAVVVLVLRAALSAAEKNEGTQKPKILG